MSPTPNDKAQPSGLWTLVTSAITILLLLVGSLMIQPRLTDRRAKIDDRFVLTAAEVRALPKGTLAVVLDRDPGQDQNDFKFQLLKLVLERSGQPYAMGLSEELISQDEAVALLRGANTTSITVGVYGAGAELNQRLRAIPIPITGGILGLRAGWSHVDELDVLATLNNRDDLRSIVLLQGLGWSDVEIFDASGLKTYTARSQDLFRLVDNRRVQLFPRGIAELEGEARVVHSSTSDTVLDPHVLLAYPFAGFFYVSPNNEPLAAAIQQGFEAALADGSYQRLVEQQIFTPWLRHHLNLADRVVVFLPSPDAAEVLNDVDPQHWIVPWRDLLNGQITRGEQLCSLPKLKALCR